MKRGCSGASGRSASQALQQTLCQSQWQDLGTVMQGDDADIMVKVSACMLAHTVVDAVLAEGTRGVSSRNACVRQRLLEDHRVVKMAGRVHACAGGPTLATSRAWVQSLCVDRFWVAGAPAGVQWGPAGSVGWLCLRDTAQWMASADVVRATERCKATLVDVMLLLVDQGLAGLLLAVCAPGGAGVGPSAADALVDVVMRSSWVSVPPPQLPFPGGQDGAGKGKGMGKVSVVPVGCPEVRLVLQEGGRLWTPRTNLYAVSRVCSRVSGVDASSLPLVALAFDSLCKTAARGDGGYLYQMALTSVLHGLVLPCLREVWGSPPSALWASVGPCVVQPLVAALTGPAVGWYSGSMVVDLVENLVTLALDTGGPEAAMELVDVVVTVAQVLPTRFYTHDDMGRLVDRAVTLQRSLPRGAWPFRLGLVVAALLPKCSAYASRPMGAGGYPLDRRAFFLRLQSLVEAVQVPPGTPSAVASASQPVADAVVAVYVKHLPVLRRTEDVDLARAVVQLATHPSDVVVAFGPRGEDVLVPFVASLPHVQAWSPLRALWVQTVVRLGLGRSPLSQSLSQSAGHVHRSKMRRVHH